MSFTPEELEAMQAKPSRKGRKKAPSSVHTNAATTAIAQSQEAKKGILAPPQDAVGRISDALDKAEEKRSEMLDSLTDRAAALMDAAILERDFLLLLSHKVQKTSEESLQSDPADAIERMADLYEAFTDWDYPAFTGFTPVGTLTGF